MPPLRGSNFGDSAHRLSTQKRISCMRKQIPPSVSPLCGCDQVGMTKIRLQVFDEGVGDIGSVVVGYSRGLAFYVFHQAVEVVARRGDADYADGGAVPESGGVEFGDGNVEAGAETVFEAA